MTDSAPLPKLLQIEPTNACNFTCDMCLHASAGDKKEAYLPMRVYEALATEVFPTLDTLILFGWGEPLMHPDFVAMLRLARRMLPATAQIKVTSNGSLLNTSIIDDIFNNNLIDHLNISCDTPPGQSTDFPGHHSHPDRVFENLTYALQHPMRSNVRIGIETVIMRSTRDSLPELVDQFGRLGVDCIFVSHVFPYHAQLEQEMLYSLMSSEALAIFEKIGDIDPQVWFGLPRSTDTPSRLSGISDYQACILEQARTDGIKLNYPLFQSLKKRSAEFDATRAIFEHTRRNAAAHNVLLDLPPLFGSLKHRVCPYVQACGTVIRADGAVVPCFKNLYPHSAFFNGRTRAYSPHVFGSVINAPLAEIWNSEACRQFRADMEDMNENIAWCGDCSFSLHYCYFSEEARHDCMLNEPFCADCPFSLNLTRCVL